MSKNKRSLEVLKNLIGEDLFMITMRTFAGQRLIFPKGDSFMDKEQRNRCIKEDYHSGMSVPDLMKRYELCESYIYKIISEKVS